MKTENNQETIKSDLLTKITESEIDGEIIKWYRMAPEERFVESQKLWEVFFFFGGSYDPGPDTQSPLYFYHF